jgi:hypothetical protein
LNNGQNGILGQLRRIPVLPVITDMLWIGVYTAARNAFIQQNTGTIRKWLIGIVQKQKTSHWGNNDFVEFLLKIHHAPIPSILCYGF